MRIWFDTEFLEDGRTIDLISIGMIAEDGRELYLINENAPLDRIATHGWLLENVVPSLPLGRDRDGKLFWNTLHPDHARLRYIPQIADSVAAFITNSPHGDACPELWAWYAAYDHVALCQLWGPMVKLPKGVPMYTRDVKQEAERLGNPNLSESTMAGPEGLRGPEHNALADADLTRRRHLALLAIDERTNDRLRRNVIGYHIDGKTYDPADVVIMWRGDEAHG